jgi:thiosulfate/3-mercaptopyruvate sulfurtransferase
MSILTTGVRRRVISTIASVAIAALASIGLGAAPASADANPNAVVSADWLEANLNNPRVKLLEVTVEDGAYARGHIRNAVEIRWHTDLVDTVNRDVVSRANFTKLAQAAGINRDSIVVLYGDNSNWFAAWGAWIFKLYGAKDVRLLDGGRAKWEADGRALTPIVPNPAKGNFSAAKADSKLRAFLPEVLKVAKKQSKTKLVDIRSADEFSGKIFAAPGFDELAIRAGHIPTAVNVGWRQTLKADGTFKSRAELAAVYRAAGIDGRTPIITYCRIGERASHSWFVLSEILGYNVKVYDGSWTEYGNSVGVPIANPAGTVWGRK